MSSNKQGGSEPACKIVDKTGQLVMVYVDNDGTVLGRERVRGRE